MLELTVAKYEELYKSMEFLVDDKNWEKQAETAANLVINGIARYKAVSDKVGIPWIYVGLAHLMESDCCFSRQILNGERWDRETTLVPAGLGPWDSWEEAALCKEAPESLWKFKDKYTWSIGRLAKELEKLNGGGYMKRDKLSPYLWSGSNHGVGVGKYGELPPDYKPTYYPDMVSDQVGAMVVLKKMENLKIQTNVSFIA